MNEQTADSLRARVDDVGFWYHTMQLAPGVRTPGEFDLRGSVNALPWPKIAGLRCLDVATFDGFYAFEMERRGAAEVVALDLDDAADLDWLPRQVPDGFARGQQVIGKGFRLAHEVYGSSVQRVSGSVYDLDPDVHGRFDVVVCGALLQHLRDPAGALMAIRRVCRGQLLSIEQVDVLTSLVLARRPTTTLAGRNFTWAIGNVAAHRRLLSMTGWDLEDDRVLGMARGAGGHAPPTASWRTARRSAARYLLARTRDPVFCAARARPASALPQR